MAKTVAGGAQFRNFRYSWEHDSSQEAKRRKICRTFLLETIFQLESIFQLELSFGTGSLPRAKDSFPHPYVHIRLRDAEASPEDAVITTG